MLDYLVFCGRFQPIHNGHVNVIHSALEKAKTVLILVGSSFTTRTPRNPFTYQERYNMIFNSFSVEEQKRIKIFGLPDYPYNDNEWIAEVQHIVINNTEKNSSIGLIGYSKDHTSYYLKMFPKWVSVNVKTQFSTLNSSDIRTEYLRDFYRLPEETHCPKATITFMENFTKTEDFKWLVNENKYNLNYDPKAFDVIVSCVDAVVVQSGFVLLVRRKNTPGKGLLALPGGHVNIKEKFIDAVIRELKEETRISDNKGEIPPAILKSFITKHEFFDDPNRTSRARVTSMVYFFELPKKTELYHVKGDDDAERAQWYPIGTLNPMEFHDDHFHILMHMLNN